MKEDRALQIEREVMYVYLNNIPFDTMDAVSAFHVGRVIGMMHITLREELKKEVEHENKN